MKCAKTFKRSLSALILAGFLVQTFACGTIIYPERRGQKSGRIDIQVAILDGLGLLLFIIPGVIAYAVDFTTGAIFLPGGSKSSPNSEGIKVVQLNPSELSKKTITEIVAKETGISQSFVLNQAEIYKLNKNDDVRTRLAEIRRSGYQTQN